MSGIVKRANTDKVVFAFQPKPFQLEISKVAKDFVERAKTTASGFEVSEIVSQAARIHELRRKDSESQLEEAVLARMKEIEEEAYKKAYELGLTEGSEQAFQAKTIEINLQLDQLATTMASISTMKTQVLQQNEAFFIKLIYQIASKIALFEIKEQRAPLVEFIRPIVEATEVEDRVMINICKEDLDFITDLETRSGKKMAMDKVKLNVSSEITPGGCIIESNFGSIDASVETRVAKAWSALEAKLPRLKNHHIDLQPENVVTEDIAAEAAPADKSENKSDNKPDDDKGEPA